MPDAWIMFVYPANVILCVLDLRWQDVHLVAVIQFQVA